MGLLEPINTRITDPQYFLDSPQQGRSPRPGLPPVPLTLAPSLSVTPPPGFSPSGSHLTEGWKTQPPVTNGRWEKRVLFRGHVLQIWEEWWGLRGL